MLDCAQRRLQRVQTFSLQCLDTLFAALQKSRPPLSTRAALWTPEDDCARRIFASLRNARAKHRPRRRRIFASRPPHRQKPKLQRGLRLFFPGITEPFRVRNPQSIQSRQKQKTLKSPFVQSGKKSHERREDYSLRLLLLPARRLRGAVSFEEEKSTPVKDSTQAANIRVCLWKAFNMLADAANHTPPTELPIF